MQFEEFNEMDQHVYISPNIPMYENKKFHLYKILKSELPIDVLFQKARQLFFSHSFKKDIEATDIYSEMVSFIAGQNVKQFSEMYKNVEYHLIQNADQIQKKIVEKLDQFLKIVAKKEKSKIIKSQTFYSKKLEQYYIEIDFIMDKYKDFEEDKLDFFNNFIFYDFNISETQVTKFNVLSNYLRQKLEISYPEKRIEETFARNLIIIDLLKIKFPVYYIRCKNKNKKMDYQEFFDLFMQSIKLTFYKIKEKPDFGEKIVTSNKCFVLEFNLFE